MPSQRCDLVVVALKGVDHAVQIAEIPDADRLVGRTSGNNVVRTRGKGDRVDSIGMAGALQRGFGGIRFAGIQDLEGQIVRDCSDYCLVDGVVLNIINDSCVVSVGPRGLNNIVGRCDGF